MIHLRLQIKQSEHADKQPCSKLIDQTHTYIQSEHIKRRLMFKDMLLLQNAFIQKNHSMHQLTEQCNFQTTFVKSRVKQVCIDPCPSDHNARCWPLLLSGTSRYQSTAGKQLLTQLLIDGTNEQMDTCLAHRRFR